MYGLSAIDMNFEAPTVSFSPLEAMVVYILVIILISGILTDYFTKIIRTGGIITKLSSFLLLTIVMGHLIFIEDNSLAETITVIFALILSFASIIIHKVLLYFKGTPVVHI